MKLILLGVILIPVWYGWSIKLSVGENNFRLEQYPLKRFFQKQKVIYEHNKVVESSPDDAFNFNEE